MTSYKDPLPEGFRGKAMVRGDLLPARLQRDALAAYLHRYTREHRPLWSRKPRDNGAPYPVQFASDAEWLARTLFPVTVRTCPASLDWRRGACRGYATWPDGLTEEGKAKAGEVRTDVPAVEIEA